MGLTLDSSVLIAAEREQLPVSELLSNIRASQGETEFLLSSVTAMELAHGIHRASRPDTALKRQRYVDEVLAVILVEPFTLEMGKLAAKIDADLKKTGVVVATADLLIGVTALHFGYAIATRNVRHFQKIPGLQVISL